jgi:hypothetical protein
MFEAYRRLGHHVAMTTMKPALPPLQTGINARNQIAKLFERMYALWYPRTPEMDKYLADHIKQYESLLTEMRQSKELANLEAALNDPRTDEELHLAGLGIIPWAAPADLAPGAAIFATQFANVLFDFMYTVYTDLQLAFPDNRVSPHAEWWICLFRRWCRVNLMQESWKTHIPTLPTEFRLFARRELGLPHVPGFIE